MEVRVGKKLAMKKTLVKGQQSKKRLTVVNVG
jgi:hypothetical protein